MKNKIYPFLLGLSCIVIVALVSFKNSEKAGEKEQMTIIVIGYPKVYDIYISTQAKDDHIEKIKTDDSFAMSEILKRINQFEKEGWIVKSSNFNNQGTANVPFSMYYFLEREKQ